MNVLLLGTGTQGLVMTKSLNRLGHKVLLLISERGNYADFSRYASKRIILKNCKDSLKYLERFIQIIHLYSIDAVIPMSDKNAEFLSKNKKLLCQHVKFLMPDYQNFMCGYNKSKLMKLCKDNGYPHPTTQENINTIEDINIKKLVFPLLIKPNQTCGGRGMTLVNNYEQLVECLPSIVKKHGTCHLQQYIRQGGAQVEVQLFIDEKKQLLQSSVIKKYRWYPEKGGSSCCATCIKNDEIVNILYDLLLKINWVGFADFDTIEDPNSGQLLIMELNPRVPACVKTAIVSGIDWGRIIVNGYTGHPQIHSELKTGKIVRHLGFEILWFLKSPNRWKTKPNWFKMINNNIYYQDMSDWTDPLPFVFGTCRNFINLIFHKSKTPLNFL